METGSEARHYELPESERGHRRSKRRYDSDESTTERGHSRSKRRYDSDESTTDRISALPDCLLLHILDFLEMKDAVKTGVLSKRWAYLWTRISNLVYICRARKGMIAFVNRTLALHEASKIKRFFVGFQFNDSGFQRQVDLWVRIATRKGVDELHLDFHFLSRVFYKLPLHLFTNSSLTKLILSYCNFPPIERICWTSLKCLSIKGADFSNDELQAILSGSPRLVYLKLVDGRRFSRIDFSSHMLKKFAIRGYCGVDVPVLEILGPNLRSFEASEFLLTKCKLTNVSSLNDVCLNLCFEVHIDDEDSPRMYEHFKAMSELLESLYYVKELTVGAWCIWVLSIWKMKRIASPISERTCLILKTDISKRDFPGIASLLESSPDLEKLVIDLACPDELAARNPEFDYVPFDFDGEKYWALQKRTFKCLLLHLKTIEIFGFSQYGTVGLLPSFIKFLLSNAWVLEKMVIYKKRAKYPQELLEVEQKLLNFPVSSPIAVVRCQEVL